VLLIIAIWLGVKHNTIVSKSTSTTSPSLTEIEKAQINNPSQQNYKQNLEALKTKLESYISQAPVKTTTVTTKTTKMSGGLFY
jgi:hypothetical protein